MNRVSFGDFVLDVSSRELRQADRVVSLSPKAYQLLEILVANRPKALSKYTLQEHLWPDTYVLDKNLVNLIAEIRRALCDDPAEPRFVRTVHRFGYAFRVAPTEVAVGHTTKDPASPRFRLEWGDGSARLGEGEYVLGRDPNLELFFDSSSVSRRHALIRITGDSATIEDLDSKNGTFVADRSLAAPTQLRDGDRIRIGSVQLRFKTVRTPASTRTERRPRRTDVPGLT